MSETGLQTCPRCGKAQPPDGFAPGNRGKRGAYCRACNREYQAAWQAANRPEPQRCAHEGCDVVINRRLTLCPEHKPPPERTTWPASNVHVSYTAMHHRVNRSRGSAAEHFCVDDCGRRANAWSYDHMDPFEVAEAREDRRGGLREIAYSLSPAHYQPRCDSCHFYFDRGWGSWEPCMVSGCTSRTPHSYCAKHRIGALRFGPGKGMALGYRQPLIDEYGRKRARRNADLVARAFVASTMTHKRCNGCDKTLPVDCFGVIKARIERPDPYKAICLACDREKGLAKYRAKIGKK